MTYNELINITQIKLKNFEIHKNKNIIIEEIASLIVEYVISNNLNIFDFDFDKFYIILEYDWDKII